VGIDSVGEVLDSSRKDGVVRKSGAWYYVEDGSSGSRHDGCGPVKIIFP